jgi:hypothetical protein
MSAWDDAALCTDADLTSQESRMPEIAQKGKSENGASAYDGKRALVKRDLESWMERRGVNPDALKRPAQLNRAAVFLELAYIYRDLAQRNDTVAAGKADYYQERFDEEIGGVRLAIDAITPEAEQTVRVRPLMWRA